MGEKRYGGPLSVKVTRESAVPSSWDRVPVCLVLLEGAGGKGWDVMVNCISKFYMHDLTKVLVIVKFFSVNPYIDPSINILFFSIIFRHF